MNLNVECKYAIETATFQEVADLLCDRVGTARVKVVIHGRMQRRKGQAMLESGVLRLSPTIIHNIDEVDDVIRHEVAHFLAWRLFDCSNHSGAWRHCCTITGARPEQYHRANHNDINTLVQYKYVYKCGDGCVHYSYRIARSYTRAGVVCSKHGNSFIAYKILGRKSEEGIDTKFTRE